MGEKVKVLIGESEGTELAFQEERALNAELSEFDDSNVDFTAEDIQEAIEKVEDGYKNSWKLQQHLVKNGSGSNSWMSDCESGIPTNRTGVIVPFECKLQYVTFSNREADDDLEIRLTAHYVEDDEDGSIGTSDPEEFEIESTDPEVIQRFEEEQAWTYDATGKNITLKPDRRYAFRLRALDESFNEVKIVLYLEKV